MLNLSPFSLIVRLFFSGSPPHVTRLVIPGRIREAINRMFWGRFGADMGKKGFKRTAPFLTYSYVLVVFMPLVFWIRNAINHILPCPKLRGSCRTVSCISSANNLRIETATRAGTTVLQMRSANNLFLSANTLTQPTMLRGTLHPADNSQTAKNTISEINECTYGTPPHSVLGRKCAATQRGTELSRATLAARSVYLREGRAANA